MRRSVVTFVLIAISTGVGCRGPWTRDVAIPQAIVTAPSQPEGAIATVAAEVNEPAEKSQGEAFAKVLDELTEIGAVDPEAKRLLMADLQEAKPENWPLIVQQFRSALAFRQQLAEREQKAANESLTVEQTTELVVAKPKTEPSFASPVDSRPEAVPVSLEIKQTLPIGKQSQLVAAISNSPTITQPVQRKPPQQVTQQASFVTNVAPALGWKGPLQTAITDLQASVQASPGSTDEVNEHLRLRMLQLLAGDEEAALGPIPGANATQQDYWNKQLFAVSTFLDSSRQPDDKRRAAGSLMHLDLARAKLAELATLQVHKLAFVDSVEGYGDYELHEASEFRPGDRVTLYAEIENFSSESTKEGYRTRLGTSYEVVDKNGKRVDSAQFPEIEDLCRNPRRDFHMQYTVTLPTRIYPEQYELRLIITDQQSHKIGQASVSFEITE